VRPFCFCGVARAICGSAPCARPPRLGVPLRRSVAHRVRSHKEPTGNSIRCSRACMLPCRSALVRDHPYRAARPGVAVAHKCAPTTSSRPATLSIGWLLMWLLTWILMWLLGSPYVAARPAAGMTSKKKTAAHTNNEARLAPQPNPLPAGERGSKKPSGQRETHIGPCGPSPPVLSSNASLTVFNNRNVETGLSTRYRCSITGNSSISGGASGRASKSTAPR